MNHQISNEDYYNEDYYNEDYYNEDLYGNYTGDIIMVDPLYQNILIGFGVSYILFCLYQNHTHRNNIYRNREIRTPLLNNENNNNNNKDIKKKEIIYKISMYDKECSICLDPFKKDETLLKIDCHHYFHKKCLLEWFINHSTCPLCRLNLL